jgi:hypothetical protein
MHTEGIVCFKKGGGGGAGGREGDGHGLGSPSADHGTAPRLQCRQSRSGPPPPHQLNARAFRHFLGIKVADSRLSAILLRSESRCVCESG